MVKKTTYEEEVKKIKISPVSKLMAVVLFMIFLVLLWFVGVFLVKLVWVGTKFVWGVF